MEAKARDRGQGGGEGHDAGLMVMGLRRGGGGGGRARGSETLFPPWAAQGRRGHQKEAVVLIPFVAPQ